MKNQYFGDIHDYIKYGLLRQLSCHGKLSTAVCWMLTQNNARQDGRSIAYLREPESWRRFDPPLFDCLRSAVLDHELRNVEIVEKSGLLTNSLFYSTLLSDCSADRDNYLIMCADLFYKAALTRNCVCCLIVLVKIFFLNCYSEHLAIQVADDARCVQRRRWSRTRSRSG